MSNTANRAAAGEQVEIWEGIHPSFPAAAKDVVGPGFGGDVWRTRTRASAEECLASLRAGRPIPQFYKQRSALLPVVAAMMLAGRDRLRILDFGGALGIGFMTLAESIVDSMERIEYTIVEIPPVCEEGRKLFAEMSAVRYEPALPGGTFGLVHAASAIQYVDDWGGLLTSLANYRAEYMLLSDVFAGPIPSFVTLQNYYESRIRHWFINFDELLGVCTKAGYTLVMKSFTTSRRLGADDTLPMAGFPETHRLAESLHLLLRRNR